MVLWKPIDGYEGYYEVSNAGEIRGLMCRWGPKVTILKPSVNRGGYKQVVLTVKRVPKTVRVHRAVALAFVDNTFSKQYVNHMDGDKLNNSFANLEWVTSSENNMHAVATGLRKIRGATRHGAHLDPGDVRSIRALEGHLSQTQLAEMYGISLSAINSILSRRLWLHVV